MGSQATPGLPNSPGLHIGSGAQSNYSSGQEAPAPATPTGPSNLTTLPSGYGASPTQQAAMQAASAQAVKTGSPVVVSSLTTPDEQVMAGPKGGYQLTSNAEPVRTEQHGRWLPVNMTLQRNADGTWSPDATAYGTVAFSGGGNTPLVTTHFGTTNVTLSWPGSLPTPVIHDATATYPSVLPSVDLVVAATPSGGFTDTLVVKSAAAAKNPKLATLALGTTVTGGRLAATTGSSLAVFDGHGHQLMDAPTPLMWDSNTTLPAHRTATAGGGSTVKAAADPSDASHPGLAARMAVVRPKVLGASLSLTPDPRMLTARSTVFPVYIDPTFNWHPYDPAAPSFDEVKQGCPTVSFYDQTGSNADNGYLGVGDNGWQVGACDPGIEHAIYQWHLSSTIWGAHISSATVEADEIYSAACGAGSYTVNLHWSGGIGSSTDWNNRPGYLSYSTSANFPRAYNPTYCPNNGSVSEGLNVTSPIADMASSHGTSFAATLSEDSAESRGDINGFSRFSNNPALQVEYNIIPSAPTASTMSAVSGADDAACATGSPYPYMGKTIASTPPVLKARVADPDGDKLQATFQYWIDGSTTKNSGVSGDNLNSGSYATYSLPSSFTSGLSNGQVVDWQAKITDGEDSTSYSQSPTCHFTAEPTAPDAPTIASENNQYPNTDNGGGPGAAANTPGKFDLSVTGGATATKFVYNLDVAPPTTNPPANEVVTATNNAATITVTPPSPGPHTLWVYAVDAAGDISGDPGYDFTATGDATTPCGSLQACMDNTAISPDSNMSLGAADGYSSFSATDLTNAGWNSGGKVTIDGATFTLPAYGSGQKDNVLAANQQVTFSGSGNALMFLATSTNVAFTDPGALSNDDTAPYVPQNTPISGSWCFNGTDPATACAATGTITYTDNTTAQYSLTVPDWITGPYSLAGVQLPHWNKPSGQVTNSATQPKIYPFAVPIDPTKTIKSVTLPDVSNQTNQFQGSTEALHIFSMATRNTTTGTAEANGTTVAAPSGQSWTGGWANPNEGSYNFQGSNFNNQTFRIAMAPTVSGNTVRIKLDNALGTSALSIGHATIAVDSTDSNGNATPAAAATPTTLTFSGSQSVTIPEGGMVYSDPLSFTINAGQDLLVSYQLSNSAAYLVQHSAANDAYQWLTAVGAGDKTTDTTGTPFTGTGTYQGWFTDLVTDLDVATSGTPTQAVLGDQLTDSQQPNAKANLSQARLTDYLLDDEITAPNSFGTIAEGISSNQLMTDYGETNSVGALIGGPSALSRIDRDILDQPGMSNVIIAEGLEDLLYGRQATDLDANGYTALNSQLNGWGLTSTYASLTPCDNYAGGGGKPNDPCNTSTSANPPVDANRIAVNNFLRGDNLGNPFAPSGPKVFFADTATALSVPDPNNNTLNELDAPADNGDHVNLTTTGYAAEANTILPPHDSWPLNDGGGFTAQDSAVADQALSTSGDATVGADPLALNGTTTWTTDNTRGQTLTFDGSTGYAAGSGPALNTAGSYTISAWVNLSSLPTATATIASQDGNVNSPFYLTCTNSSWTFGLSDSDATGATVHQATATGATTGWTHLVGVYVAPWKEAGLYVNGQLAAVITGVTSWNSTGPFTLGRDKTNGTDSDYFPGQINNVQTWNYALTGGQISALYQQIQ
ncbi:hypothetical protein NGB36_18250 [Streptomyces sp. RB6PN25]|uniref:LamG-like jellyroll fold domain-containing protein n=1 Tax=Streptomyces humicola TaxID=2953240 RepID=A0ABT1Q124_9ACTN|nr:LamG-like jellyroll fold domain-containing protein [Streptomyces humicola]MCQ4082490.1 hypothetical protein [Streptomyces humicola]